MAETEVHDKEARARQMRGRIFSAKNKQRRSVTVEFFDEQIEIRQPTLRDISEMSEDQTQQSAIVSVLIKYAYIPGTDERVFDDVHAEELLGLPFDDNFVRVSDAVKSLTLKSVSAEKND